MKEKEKDKERLFFLTVRSLKMLSNVSIRSPAEGPVVLCAPEVLPTGGSGRAGSLGVSRSPRLSGARGPCGGSALCSASV